MMMMTTTMKMTMMMALMNEPVHEVGEVPSRHRASVPVTHMAETITITITRPSNTCVHRQQKNNNNNKNSNPSQKHMWLEMSFYQIRNVFDFSTLCWLFVLACNNNNNNCNTSQYFYPKNFVVHTFLGILSFYCFMIFDCLLHCLVKSYHWLGNLLKTSALFVCLHHQNQCHLHQCHSLNRRRLATKLL